MRNEGRSRPPLRFDVGSEVLFKAFNENGWSQGTVIAHWFRGPDWPDEHPTAAYLVLRNPSCGGEEGDEELCAPALEDTDDWIRVLPEDQTPDPSKLDKLPEPIDPRSWEYTGLRNTMDEAMCRDVAAQFENSGFVDQVRHNPDGRMTFDLNSSHPRESFTTATIDLPPEERHGIPPKVIANIALTLNNRRHIQGNLMLDLERLLESIVPKEKSLAELEHASKSDNTKMLLLGDAYVRCSWLAERSNEGLFMLQSSCLGVLGRRTANKTWNTCGRSRSSLCSGLLMSRFHSKGNFAPRHNGQCPH